MQKNPSNAKVGLRSLIDQYQENCARIQEIAELCEKENRSRNEAESIEFENLRQSNELLRMKIEIAKNPDQVRNCGYKEFNDILCRNFKSGRQSKFILKRDVMLTEDITDGGIVSLNVGEILKPLTEGIITSKVGIPMPTGLAGDYVWPVYSAVEATIVNEGVALDDTAVDLSKLSATPQRIGVAIPASRESLNQSSGTLETIIKDVLPNSLLRAINKILFSPTKVTNASTLIGPFYSLINAQSEGTDNAGTYSSAAGSTPTLLELSTLKGDVLSTGIDGDKLCWIMTKSNKAILEATPKDSGSGIMICENDHILGLPVYTTNYITDSYIGLGDWSYQPMGLFGEVSFIVDPYSQARKNAVDFVLNADYGTVTLREEAFGVLALA